MKKGIHPQMQWVSVVTEDGRLMHLMVAKIHHAGQVFHMKAKRQMAQSIGRIAKFRQRYGMGTSEQGTAEKPEK
ncbi:hypothetical protein L484_012469 [Morus notabilis]|uniref:Uncharacterized protein n=1 Tax=Morus notabilis TaxID=981085 RepID=W9RBD1_9ROSA|nr:uncharacterized protein LOC21395682 [Morus notabilis]XP_024021206.1 uncharacterized protein LOC21395682 [Morus notabilis]EXB63279.1 hypothetical protein L484_012469 [Morus notabilis]